MGEGRRVLVVGGAGSLGRELCDLLIGEGDTVVVLDNNEDGLNSLHERYGLTRFRPFLGDIRDRDRCVEAIEGCGVIIHAAASKHLWLGEYTPKEVLKTNILGTQNLIDAAISEGAVKTFMFVSSDKAVNPSCFYGQTKAVAEGLVLHANKVKGDRPTAFSVYRPCNFFMSRGNVIEKWLEQRRDGRPLTLSRGEFTRYFIGTARAARLLLKAVELARGGEIFIPRGREYRMSELAELISGRVTLVEPNPSEKFSEELFTEVESRMIQDMGDLLVIKYP